MNLREIEFDPNTKCRRQTWQLHLLSCLSMIILCNSATLWGVSAANDESCHRVSCVFWRVLSPFCCVSNYLEPQRSSSSSPQLLVNLKTSWNTQNPPFQSQNTSHNFRFSKYFLFAFYCWSFFICFHRFVCLESFIQFAWLRSSKKFCEPIRRRSPQWSEWGGRLVNWFLALFS
jgi:hypothetical protein